MLKRAPWARSKAPKHLVHKVEVMSGEMLYWQAYNDLSTERPSSFGGAMPIPWSRVQYYAEKQKFDWYQTDTLHLVCAALDKVYIEWAAKEYDKKHGDKQKFPGTRSQATRPSKAPSRRRSRARRS